MYFSTYNDQSSRSLKRKLRDRLVYFHHSGFDEYRSDGNRIRARHARVFNLLHNHITSVGFRSCRRQNQVAVRSRVSPGFTEHAESEFVGLGLEIYHFFKHGLTRYITDSANNHTTGLTTRMGVDGLDPIR